MSPSGRNLPPSQFGEGMGMVGMKTKTKPNKVSNAINLDIASQPVKVTFYPATGTKGARYKVKGNDGQKVYPFPYEVTNPREYVAKQYLTESTGLSQWWLAQIAEAPGYASYYAYDQNPNLNSIVKEVI